MLLFFPLTIIHSINVPLTHLFLSVFREISFSISSEHTFPMLYSFLKVFFDIGSWNQSFSLFYCVCEYKGFNKMVENSALRYQFFIVFFRHYFIRGESHVDNQHFSRTETSHKNFFSKCMTKSAVSCGFGHIYWRNP